LDFDVLGGVFEAEEEGSGIFDILLIIQSVFDVFLIRLRDGTAREELEDAYSTDAVAFVWSSANVGIVCCWR
jgi:hypothetical protein